MGRHSFDLEPLTKQDGDHGVRVAFGSVKAAVWVQVPLFPPSNNSRVADNRADLVNRMMWVTSPIPRSIDH